MFVQSMKLIKAYSGRNDNVFIFGQKSNPDTWKMAKINMAIRGIEANLGVYPKDTFVIDLQAGERFDFIMAPSACRTEGRKIWWMTCVHSSLDSEIN